MRDADGAGSGPMLDPPAAKFLLMAAAKMSASVVHPTGSSQTSAEAECTIVDGSGATAARGQV